MACASNRIQDLLKARWEFMLLSASLIEVTLRMLLLWEDFKLRTVEEMHTQANGIWNGDSKPELSKWLKAKQCPSDKARLKAVGNIVFPKCAQLAVNVIAHQILKE